MLDGQENKMRTQIAISPGTQVKHERYGIGTVVKEWGSWLCCKVCLTPLKTRSAPENAASANTRENRFKSIVAESLMFVLRSMERKVLTFVD
jgi:hypothetical protein